MRLHERGGPVEPAGDDAGFTLIEVLTAMVIFAVVSMGLLHSVLSAVDTSGDSRSRVVAANLAAGAIDQARADAGTDLDAVDTTSWTVEVEGTTYTLARSATWVLGDGGTSCGASAGASLRYKRVGVRVSWPNMGGTEPVRSDTVISPPAGVFDPLTGNLAVSVLDRDAGPVEFAQVRLTGPTTSVAQTDDGGCAFFAGIPAGSYAVVVTKSGHVNPQGAVEATGSATAVEGETVSYQADFDRAATLEVDGLADPTGDEVDDDDFPLPAGSVLTLAHPSLQQGRRVLPVAVGVEVGGIYPFAGGYSTWLGSCSDAAPQGSSTADPPAPWWPGGTTETPVTAVDPGDDTEVTVRGAQLEVRITTAGLPGGGGGGGGGGEPGPPAVPGVLVRAEHAPEAGIGCNAGESWVLGTTGADGTVRATLPYGKAWRIVANGTVVGTVTLDPDDEYPKQVQP